MPDRLDVGDGDSVPMTIAAIQPGDYIRSKLDSRIIGRVVSRGLLANRHPAFFIKQYKGNPNVILESDTVILGFVDCRPPT